MLSSLLAALRGKRTYLVALGLLVGALVKLLDGADLGAVYDEVLVAVGLITARAKYKDGPETPASPKAPPRPYGALLALVLPVSLLSGCVSAEARATAHALDRDVPVLLEMLVPTSTATPAELRHIEELRTLIRENLRSLKRDLSARPSVRSPWLSAVASPVTAAQGKARTRREVVIRGHPFPPNVVVLVDASASMQGAAYARAVREALRVAEQVGDGGRIVFGIFGDKVLTTDPRGWYDLPDRDRTEAAALWLLNTWPDGSTPLAKAVLEVLDWPVADLGIVVVTDAEPDGGPVSAAAKITAVNQERVPPATIGVVSIDPGSKHADSFGLLVARGASGAYLRVTTREKGVR